jgi:3-oxoadipate enol-lactonase
MQVFADDGARIDVCVDGQQRTRVVIFIHGFPFAREIWDAQRDALEKIACVIRIDLRGAGASSVPEGPYLMEVLAGDVAATMDALAIERATLVGHSMGGYVALAFARMFTERVAGLALVSSRLAADTPEQSAARHNLAERVEHERNLEPVVNAYLTRMFSPQTRAQRGDVIERAYAIARRNDPMGAAAALRGMALRASSEDIAGDFEMPALIVAGGRDDIISVEESSSNAQRFTNGSLVVCDGSGHLPMMEEPARVNDALARWLSGD